MKCSLNINHSHIRDVFREKYIECPLLKRSGAGMNQMEIICAGCCLRIQHLIEAKKDLLLRQIIDYRDYKQNPEMIKEYLPENLLVYYSAIRRLGLRLEDIEFECNRCRAEIIGQKPVHFRESTEMTAIGDTDLR